MEWGLRAPITPRLGGNCWGATAPWQNRSRTKKNKPALNTKLRILPRLHAKLLLCSDRHLVWALYTCVLRFRPGERNRCCDSRTPCHHCSNWKVVSRAYCLLRLLVIYIVASIEENSFPNHATAAQTPSSTTDGEDTIRDPPALASDHARPAGSPSR